MPEHVELFDSVNITQVSSLTEHCHPSWNLAQALQTILLSSFQLKHVMKVGTSISQLEFQNLTVHLSLWIKCSDLHVRYVS
jgi:hypothetical protein